MEVAETISKRSRCDRAQVGAVIVDSMQRICSTGYNGPAATFPGLGQCSGWCQRAQGLAPIDSYYDACPSIHAEANALLYVDRTRVGRGTIYINRSACMQCAKLISNSGLSRVVMKITDLDAHREPDKVVAYLESCGIEVIIYSEDPWQD